MNGKRLSDTIRTASAVNLRYSADLLNLAKRYVKDFSDALMADAEAETGPNREGFVRRPTLLVAGRTGELANAAFALTSSAGMTGTVSLKTVGDFADSKVRVEPDVLSLESGQDAIARILAKIGKNTPPGIDHFGAVVIAGSDRKIADFVLRKLPD